MEEIEQAIWLKQPWEKDIAYNRFREYYLSIRNNSERTTLNAYRNYYKTKNGTDYKGHAPPGAWQQWSRGQDRSGKKVGHSWLERAAAYDLFTITLKDQALEEIRSDIENQEYRDYEKGLNVWEKLVEDFNRKMDAERRKADSKNLPFDPRGYIKGFGDLIVQREKLSVLARRSRNMPTVISEDRLRNADDEKPLVIEWKEPVIKDDEIGAGESVIHEFLRRKHASKQDSTEG